jgi:hypothetical protein
MKLQWEVTGDWLEIEPINYNLASYWVTQLDQANINKFKLIDTKLDLTWIASLTEHVHTVNQFLVEKLKITELNRFVNSDFIDQNVLNDLHRTWIGLIAKNSNLVRLLQLRDSTLYHHWNQINKKVHLIEEGFRSTYLAQQYWNTPNIFGSEILSFNQCQVTINFSQEGRTTFNKWRMFDINNEDYDTNNYVDIGSEVSINLGMPIYYDPPSNYVDYCKQHNLSVTGEKLNLGNFLDFETKLFEIRHVYIRNISLENNTASFRF